MYCRAVHSLCRQMFDMHAMHLCMLGTRRRAPKDFGAYTGVHSTLLHTMDMHASAYEGYVLAYLVLSLTAAHSVTPRTTWVVFFLCGWPTVHSRWHAHSSWTTGAWSLTEPVLPSGFSRKGGLCHCRHWNISGRAVRLHALGHTSCQHAHSGHAYTCNHRNLFCNCIQKNRRRKCCVGMHDGRDRHHGC